MAIAATETTSLIAFTLPSTPYSVQMARFYVRAALSYHDLGDYAEDAEIGHLRTRHQRDNARRRAGRSASK